MPWVVDENINFSDIASTGQNNLFLTNFCHNHKFMTIWLLFHFQSIKNMKTSEFNVNWKTGNLPKSDISACFHIIPYSYSLGYMPTARDLSLFHFLFIFYHFLYTLHHSNKKSHIVFRLVCLIYFSQCYIFKCIHFPTEVSCVIFYSLIEFHYINTTLPSSSHLLMVYRLLPGVSYGILWYNDWYVCVLITFISLLT